MILLHAADGFRGLPGGLGGNGVADQNDGRHGGQTQCEPTANADAERAPSLAAVWDTPRR